MADEPLTNPQDRAVWLDTFLWTDEGRVERQTSPREVLVDQAYRDVHILPVVCCKFLIIYATEPFLTSRQFTAMEGHVIHGGCSSAIIGSYVIAYERFLYFVPATQYWTESNIADGLNALTTCIEVSPEPG